MCTPSATSLPLKAPLLKSHGDRAAPVGGAELMEMGELSDLAALLSPRCLAEGLLAQLSASPHSDIQPWVIKQEGTGGDLLGKELKGGESELRVEEETRLTATQLIASFNPKGW